MEKRLNPEFMPFRFELDPKMETFDAVFEKQNLTRKEVKNLIDQDAESIFEDGYVSLEELYSECTFITFEGAIKEYEERIRQRDKINFMFLAYLGKSQNDLRSNIRMPDISVLALLNRLSVFAKKVSEIAGIETKITIATENAYYDKNILLIENSIASQTMKKAEALMSDFGIKNITLQPVEKFLQGDDFQKEFDKEVMENALMKTEIINSEKHSDLKGITYYLMPTESFKSAVKRYTSQNGKEVALNKASESMARYLAFMGARDKMGFWDHNNRFVRSTLSFKPGVTTFQYSIGRMPPFHGVAIVRNSQISTEYYYDLACATSAKKLEPSMSYYNNEPFYIDPGTDL